MACDNPQTTEYLRGMEAAAKIADFYAEENFRLASDTILTDPILQRRSGDQAAIETSDQLRQDGCVYASMAHAAQNIAASIREACNAKA